MKSLTKRFLGGDLHLPLNAALSFGVGHEAGVHTTIHFFARIGKSGLGDGVVLLHEDKLDLVTLLRLNRFWLV